MASRAEYEKIQNEVLKKLRSEDKANYRRLERDPNAFKKAETAMKTTHDELEQMVKHADSLDNALKHLPPERKSLINTTFRLQSFNVGMQRKPDGLYLMFSSVKGTALSFVPTMMKVQASNFEENRVLLAARIIFEVATLVLNMVGMKVAPSEKAFAKAIELISKTLGAHANIFGDIEQMIDGAKANDMKKVANAIVACLIDLFSIVGTPILGMVKLILQDMSWYDIIMSVVQVLCFIASMIATGGVAAVANVLSWLLDASAFVQKLYQMREFKSSQSK